MLLQEQPPEQVILQAAVRLIRGKLNHLPKLTEIAAKVGTHDKRLSAIFREQLGMTVFAWVREERLRKTQELLVDSDISIEDIATQVGFFKCSKLSYSISRTFFCDTNEFSQN